MPEQDYAPLLSTQPPEGLIPWLQRKGLLDLEYLIYQTGWYYEPLEGRKKKAVKVTCTHCRRSVFAARVEAGCCRQGYTRAPFGFLHPTEGRGLVSGDDCLCPECGAKVHVKHISDMSPNWTAREVYPMTVTRVGDKLALLGWCVRKWFEKDGASGITIWPYEAYVVERRSIVRLNGYTKFMSQVRLSGQWEQRKKYEDRWGEADLVYPWDRRILEGSTAENSKLDRYLRDAKRSKPYPVTYLRLWLAHPQAENLVMQGAGRLLTGLIQAERGYDHCGRAVPKLEGVNWKERSPARMLGMDREEFRRCVAERWDRETLRFWQGELAKGRRLTVEELALAGSIAYYNCERLERDEGLDYLKTARYLGRQRERDKRCDMSILWDYWRMAREEGEDLAVADVRFPPRLMRAHDRLVQARQRRREETARAEREARAQLFARRYEELSAYAWERDGILIRPVRDEAELRREGAGLKHCVATYAGSHARGETAIFLIRRKKEPEKPWYTLELDEKKPAVRQNRGKCNCARTEEIEAFEAAWLEHIRGLAAGKKKGKKKKEVHAA